MSNESESTTQYKVKVILEKVSLSKIGIIHLACECYSDSFSESKKTMTFYFNEKQYAEAFVYFIERHALSS